MISLSDGELRIVIDAAAPIPARDRSEFQRDVASELSRYEIVGVGVVSRVSSRLQRQHMNPPSLRGVSSKWR